MTVQTFLRDADRSRRPKHSTALGRTRLSGVRAWSTPPKQGGEERRSPFRERGRGSGQWRGVGSQVFSFVSEIVQVVIELIQSCFPQPALLGQPVLSHLEPLMVDPIYSHSTHLFRLYESTTFENGKLLNERRQLHAERLCQLADRCWPSGQMLQYPPASRVGQSTENGIDRRWLGHGTGPEAGELAFQRASYLMA